MASVLVCSLAILLCLINAAMWTFVTGMPLAGFGWVIAAAFCVKLERWSRG